jgi:hypothetical protein
MTLERTFTVGTAKAKMTLDDTGRFKVSWSPHIPGALSASDLCHYQSGRNALIAEMRDVLAANDCVLRAYDHARWVETTS